MKNIKIDIKNIRLMALFMIFLNLCVFFVYSYVQAYSLKTEDVEVVYDTEEISSKDGSYTSHTEENSAKDGSNTSDTEENSAEESLYTDHAKKRIVEESSYTSDTEENSAEESSYASHTEERFADSGSYADHTEAEKDEDIRLYAKFSGGVKPYEYKYYEKLRDNDWRTICEYTNEDNISVKFPSEYGVVRYRIEAKDANGKILYKNVSVAAKTTGEFSDCGTYLNCSWRYVGTSVIAYARFRGGKTPYKYQYYYKSANGQWVALGGITYWDYKVIVLPSAGEYTIRVAAVDADGVEITKDMSVNCGYYMPLRNICQYSEPSLPTGCEVTALASCLGYYGFNVSKNVLANKYLPRGNMFYSKGKLYGPDPMTAFAGSPDSLNSFGCYAKCIETTANKYFKSVNSTGKAKDISGYDLSQLLPYIMKGKPVIVWATTYLYKTVLTSSWQTTYGKNVTWKANEHCLVLAGYDPKRKVVYVADPMINTSALTEYSYDLFKQRYDEQGKNAVIID